MALDDVVARAMSKSPGDRYPSAGDLGRAAQAALTGAAVSTPERTVATGAAATRERTVPEPAPRAAETERLPDGGEAPPGKRRPLLVGGLLALVAAAVVAALVASSGGGGDGSGIDGAVGDTVAGTTTKGPKPKPQTLNEAALIRKGDEICADSRARYKRVRDPVLEEVPDVSYSEKLVANSTEAVREFNALRPPPSLERAYRNFVASQEQVKQWDVDALNAAEAEDEVAYREAREDRNDTEDDRKELAEKVGFKECAGSDL